MKKLILPLMLLPGVALSQTLPSLLQELEDVRALTALCDMENDEQAKIEKLLVKASKRGKRGAFVTAAVVDDLVAAREACTSDKVSKQQELESQVKAADAQFPVSIFQTYTTSAKEFELDAQALEFVKAKEQNPCGEISFEQRYDGNLWHDLLLTSGWKCVAENYIAQTKEFNRQMGYSASESRYEELKSLDLKKLKQLFRDTYKDELARKELRLAFIPQLSWENGTLNTTFPYTFFTNPTELTSYRRLMKEFKKLKVPSVLIERNSLNSLDEQVEETHKKVAALKGKHLFIARSMGARVARELLAQNKPEITSKMSGLLNVGGTPHGSVIGRAKYHPDSYYRGTLRSITKAFGMPIGLIAKDPRIPDHIEDTLFSAMIRSNLNTMGPVAPSLLTQSNVPVLNAVFVRTDHERATKNVDPVWMHMLQQGPTEGSAPIHGASIDTNDSLRVIIDSDHLGFWKYTPKEALAVYLRLLIVAKEVSLVK